MKYASSLRYGGMLTDASSASYTDYKYLQLVCPCCKSPVYLVGEQKREAHSRVSPKSKKIISVSECVVGMHFSHFRGATETQAQQCELRVSRFNQSDFKRFETRARQQMLKKFQRHFWNAFSLSNAVPDDNEIRSYILGRLRKADPKVTESCVQDKLRNVCETFVFNFRQNQSVLKQAISRTLLSSREAFTGKAQSGREAFHRAVRASEPWLEKVEINMHEAIVHEAISFLCAKSSYYLLCKLFLYGAWVGKNCLFNYQWDIREPGEFKSLIKQVTGITLADLGFTKWAENLALLEEKDKKENIATSKVQL